MKNRILEKKKKKKKKKLKNGGKQKKRKKEKKKTKERDKNKPREEKKKIKNVSITYHVQLLFRSFNDISTSLNAFLTSSAAGQFLSNRASQRICN